MSCWCSARQNTHSLHVHMPANNPCHPAVHILMYAASCSTTPSGDAAVNCKGSVRHSVTGSRTCGTQPTHAPVTTSASKQANQRDLHTMHTIHIDRCTTKTNGRASPTSPEATQSNACFARRCSASLAKAEPKQTLADAGPFLPAYHLAARKR